MKPKDRVTTAAAASLLAALMVFGPANAANNTITEVRDPVRGANFYSVALSDDSLQTLQIRGGLFNEDDRMTLGFSALFFDESSRIENYIVWLRHDGPRRWFTGVDPQPVELWIGDATVQPTPINQLGGTQATGEGIFVEKLEFSLTPAQFDQLATTAEATLALRTVRGQIVKEFTAAELAAIREFQRSVGASLQRRSVPGG